MSPTTARTALLALAALALPGGALADQGKPTDQTKTSDHVAESKVYFAFDSDELSPAALAELDLAVQWIEKNETGLILVEGHTDKVGSPEYNKELGARRAQAAKQYLVAQGVPEGRIRILSYGEGLPASDTDDRARTNRRIVLFAVQKEPIVETETEVVRVGSDGAVVARDPLGIQLMLGGGLTNSLDSGTEDFVELGGAWDARVAFMNQSFIGFEAAYVGSLQQADALGLDDNAQLMGNGVEGNLRLNLLRTAPIRPYVFAGLGWTHYSMTNTDVTTSLVDEDDDVMHVPAGLGVGFHLYRGVTLDVRGTLRAAFDDEMFDRAALDDDSGLENWATSAALGFEF
jgi:peptidoglycan-associated lipoprotein